MRGVPQKWQPETNFAAFVGMLEVAAAEGVDLMVTPECWLDGYAAADKESGPVRLRDVAQEPGASSYLQSVAGKAREHAMYVCFGFTGMVGGKLYNAAGLWNRDGCLVGVYHKTHLQSHDLQFTPGGGLPVWSTEFGPIGIMICADRRWPETARTLRLQGARLILNPSYGMCHDENECWMRTRGYENQCFIAFVHPRVGFVVDPRGRIHANEEGDRPALLVCDVDLSDARDDNHIRDRRPELYGIIGQCGTDTERGRPEDDPQT